VSSLEKMLEEEREARTEERRRHDTLMAQLMQRIPELEPPSTEPRESDLRASEGEPTPTLRRTAPARRHQPRGRGGVGSSASRRIVLKGLECR